MSPDQTDVWLRFAGLLVGQGVAAYGVWAGLRAVIGRRVQTVEDKVDIASTAAGKAAELAKPMGNGYADRTEAALARLESIVSDNAALMRGLTEKIDRHLADHASSDLRRQ